MIKEYGPLVHTITCRKCKTDKHRREYYTNQSTLDHWFLYCKECTGKELQKLRDNNDYRGEWR